MHTSLYIYTYIHIYLCIYIDGIIIPACNIAYYNVHIYICIYIYKKYTNIYTYIYICFIYT